MGGSTYSSSVFDDTHVKRTAGGKDFFAHSAAISKGEIAAKVHQKLDPAKLNAVGKNVRESFDSDVHPNSLAIACLFDETGSMDIVPRIFVEKLGSFMAMLTSKGYVKNPHVLFGAIGDAYSDKVPLQIGQFEGGNEMDNVLGDIYLESNGGGQQKESYELALYYMARHTEMDCFNKRGKKGYLFLFGDELPYDKVNKDQVKRLIGDDLTEDITTAAILKELRAKFEVYWIMPKTDYWDDVGINDGLKKLFGQNLLKLENPEDVCELLVATIGIGENIDVKSIEADLVAAGSSKKSAKVATKATAHLKGA